MKKLSSMFLVLALILSLAVAPAQAAGLNASSTAPATRAVLASALWEREGKPVVNYAMQFSDVSQSASYAEAVRWAASEKLMGGVGDSLFLPDGTLDREQLATVLYRYAQYLGADVSVGEDTNILSYNDFLDRSDWAVSALQWALGSGVLASDG
ncbi:MAG: S-layer homology domain-containing protein, partial [Oscillospiraceae bacterium]|nr:S-layer homology domain-containing protein [Oscillospiraceae bacterium]